MAILSNVQRAELISQMLSGGVKRTTVGPLTVEHQPPSMTELLKLLQADQAAEAMATNRRPFRLQVQRPPGAA